MKKKILYCLCLLLFPMMVFADSDTVFNNNKYISIGDDYKLVDNFENTHIAFGSEIDVLNKVDGIYTIFGEDIEYKTSNDYVLLFGNNISISGGIRDGAIFGNNINFKDANISRDIVIFGNRVILNGNFNGNVIVFADSVIINDSNFSLDLKVYSSKLTVNSDVVISGNLEYDEDTTVRNYSNKINNIVINKNVVDENKVNILDYVYELIRLFVIFLVLYLVNSKIFNKFSNNIGKNFGYGLLSFIVLPICLLILLFTNFGLSISVIGIMLYIIMIMLSKVIFGYIIGKYIWDKIIKREERIYLIGLLGIILVYLLSIIPYIGGIITFVSLVYSFGIITNLILESRK